ncbi:hypothetical protein MMC15_002943 [Xylographa vitiligo]|nr:hypothetical protein [Xylographa vitiligo]
MADESLVSFARFEEAQNSCFNPTCDTGKSLDSFLDSFLDDSFTPKDMPLTVFRTTQKANWHIAAVYSTESSYLQLCEELRLQLYTFFRQVGLIFHQIKRTRHISGSVLLCFVVEVLCTLAKVYGAHCCGMTVKEECLDITYSESNTPEVHNDITEVQAIYDHIMNVGPEASVKTHLGNKTKRLEALLSRHDPSWSGFLSAIVPDRHVQT